MTRLLIASLVILAAAALPRAAAAQSRTTPARTTPAACDALRQLKLDGVALSVTKTEWFVANAPLPGGRAGGPPPAPSNLPAYCRLDGMIDRRTGAANVTYGIGFALALPENWNGRFLMQGGGGLNGTVGAPLGTSAAGDQSALARGFAVVSTDTGHQSTGGGFDGSFQADQQASLDFAYAAIGRVAEIAKRIIGQHYGKAPDHSYFAGCSTGGREAMLMTQRYPLLFDGVIAGAPAMRTDYSGIGDRWVAVTLNEVAPKDAQGLPVTRNALTEPQKHAVIDGIVNACDANDGIADRMVFNVNACTFDPKALTCGAQANDRCLSPAQASALEKAFAGPKDSKGRQVYPGFAWDTGLTNTQGITGLLHGGQVLGGDARSIGMDVDAAVERLQDNAAQALSTTSRWTNLNTFSGRGGKLLFWHGVSDPWFSALDTVDYYERMTKANGGADQVRNWSRLFLVPGAGHCGGGPSLDTFDALSAMVRWVEQGSAPESLPATGRAFPGRSRPLCAYPLHAQYKGQGDPENASSFECRP